MKKNLIAALRHVLGADSSTGKSFLRSGNLLNKLQDLGEEAALELADFYYDRTAKEKEVFEKGYLFGLLNKVKKPVYRIEYPPYVLYFRGTEADILRKIEKYVEEKGKKDETKTEDKKLDLDVSEKEVSKLF